ncbi:MAG: NusG domain II-containing protein [Lachnospiraceae bacterium]|nr:NusG domain II-containing protein [Lachnospiraceae bacterium]
MSLQKSSDYNLKKGDLILIAVILSITGIAALLIMQQKRGDQVIITSGEAKETYSLNESRTIRVSCESGGYNTVVIRNGMVWVEEADCKNQICVNHKPVSKNHESIVCIPHKLFIDVKSSRNNDIDN